MEKLGVTINIELMYCTLRSIQHGRRCGGGGAEGNSETTDTRDPCSMGFLHGLMCRVNLRPDNHSSDDIPCLVVDQTQALRTPLFRLTASSKSNQRYLKLKCTTLVPSCM